MNIYEKLINVQNEINAPKNQYNRFGKYYYRSCEDIQVAVKPILLKHKLTQIINDEIVNVEGRFYIKATVTLINNEKTDEIITTTAYAREPEIKPKMDESQTTGSASTYARKYALAGLYSLDDNKDSDGLAEEKKKTNQKQNNNQSSGNNNRQNTHGKGGNEQGKAGINDNNGNGKLSDKQLATLKNVAEKDKQKLVILFKSAGIEMKALEELSKQEATTLIGKLYNK